MAKKIFTLLSLVAMLSLYAPSAQAAYGDVTTYLGKLYDGDGGQAVDAYLDFPEDLVFDSSGTMYIADTYNNVIRAIDTSGVISTFAGTGSYGNTDGATTQAEFALPKGIALGASGEIYVSDGSNHTIRKIAGGVVTTVVAADQLTAPIGIAVYGDYLYILDSGSNALKRFTLSTGTMTTLNSTDLSAPTKMDITSDGSSIYVLDAGHYRILKLSATSGSVQDTIGSGTAGYVEGAFAEAQFYHLGGIVIDDDANIIYVVDQDQTRTGIIRKLNLVSRQTSQFYYDASMLGMNVDSGVRIYGDYLYLGGNGNIYRFNKSDWHDNNLVAGKERFGNRNGSASEALFGRPYDMVMSPDRQYIYVGDNNKIRRITVATGAVAHVIGNSVDGYHEGMDVPTTPVWPVRFSAIQGIVINSSGTRLYIADRWNNRIRGINLEASPVSSYLVTGAGLPNIAGTEDNGYQEGVKCADQESTGVAGCAYFQTPSGLVIDPTNTYLYVTDTGHNRIRKVRISDGQTWLVAGSGEAGYADGTGAAAKFNRPFGITMDASGSNLYVADSNNHRIRKIVIATGVVSTLAGNGSAGYQEGLGSNAVLSYPEYVKMGSDNMLYFSEVGSQRIRQLNPSTGLSKLIAGSGQRGFKNGTSTTAEFNNPKGLLIDAVTSSLYVADNWNDLIRKIDITGTAPYADPAPTVSSVSPSEVNPSWDKGSGLQVGIKGTNFRYGAKTYFGDIEGEKTYVQTGTALAVKLPLAKLSAGWYDVTVVNVDGQKSTRERALGITDSSGTTPDTYYEYSEKTAETTNNSAADSIKTASSTGFMAYASTIRGGYYIASGNVLSGANDEIVTGTGDGMAPQVRVFDSAGNAKAQFFAYASTLRTGVRVTTCDVNGDGLDEIITIPGKGALPQVRVLNAYGTPVTSGFYALDGKFTGGANLSCGDIDGNGIKDIVVAASQGGGPHVLVYDQNGKIRVNFFAYDRNFRGGIKVTTADIDGDGRDEIVTGPEVGAPHIQIFQLRGGNIHRLSPGFYAFSVDYRGGVSVAGVDTDGDGTKELLIGVGLNAQPLVKVYDIRAVQLKQFYVYASNFLGGVNLAGGDVDGDGADELLTLPRSAGGPQVRIINVDEN
jgi:DNA-binding beta-propeller fold protein YncE